MGQASIIGHVLELVHYFKYDANKILDHLYAWVEDRDDIREHMHELFSSLPKR